ncbi:MAG: TatD family hydrolase [Elusimicrobia bacterium]|nr:TatD family hydrolase [Elusimicrobiota bacterium]
MIETHAHLLDEKFDLDRDTTIARARTAGVDAIIEVGCEPANWQKTIAFAVAHKNISCVLGIHPQETIAAEPAVLDTLKNLCTHQKVVGVGETGLDYHFETSPRDMQKEVFIHHMDIARSLKKPLVIHCREAYRDLHDILTGQCSKPGSFFGVIHCFSGTLFDARELTDMGFLLGIDGPVTYPSARNLKEVVTAIPLESLVIETDCPYLPPQEYRGQRNEPSYLPLIAREIAHLKNIPAETVTAATTIAARTLFAL